MGWSREALRLLPLLFSWILAAVLLLSPESHADDVVRFLETPPAFSAAATATFKFEVAEEMNCTACGNCSLECMLDNSSCHACQSKEVTYSGLLDGNHMFVVCVSGSQRYRCATYNWTVDTIPPTAYISAASSFTNASNVSVRISFSEPCTGGGGFRCSPTYCSLLVYGAGHVLPSTLKVIQPDLDFSLMVSISEDVQFGRLVLLMDKGFCEDNATNSFRQTSNSSFTLDFDTRSVFVNLTTNVPQKLIPFGGEIRTAEATNTAKDLKIYLSFSQPVLNSSEEILHLLHLTDGLLVPTNSNDHGNLRFEYLVQNVSRRVITISCDATQIICRQGTPVSSSKPLTFLYDDERPSVRLSTTSNMRTKDRKIAVLVQFAKPVFDFNDSATVISGGHMLRFHEISKAEYEIEIHPNDSIVSVQVPENKTADIAGNLNLPSNIIQVEHYSVPTISSIVSITSTAALATTSMLAALLTISTSSLISHGAIRQKSSHVSEPSRNLVRLVCHIQVFALCRSLVMPMPIEYDEFSKGIEWTIPYIRLPWKEGSNYEDSEAWERSRFRIFKYPSFADLMLEKNRSAPPRPLAQGEYASFLQNMLVEPISKILNSTWRNFGKNIFWLAVLGGGLISLHVAILGVLKLKRKNSEKPREYGALVFPRFEMFLIPLALPCICQASGAIIKGGTPTGTAVGAVLLGITGSALISMLLFLSVGITRGKLLQYKEVHREGQQFHGYQELVRATLGPGKRGQWTWKGQQNSVNQAILGPLFEDLRGPPEYILTQIAGEGSQAMREDRIIASEDENKDVAGWGSQAKREDRIIASEDENKYVTVRGRQAMREDRIIASEDENKYVTVRGRQAMREDRIIPSEDENKDVASWGSQAKREDRIIASEDENKYVTGWGRHAKREDRIIASEDENKYVTVRGRQAMREDRIIPSEDENKDVASWGSQAKREDRIIASEDENKYVTGWGRHAKREDRIIASEDENKEPEAPFIQKLFGILRIYYPFLESAKRVTLGILAGVYSSSRSKPSRKPSLIILAITSFQLLFLVLKKPFIKKRVQFVEIISVACEAGLFAACLVLSEKKPDRASKPSGAYESRVGLSMVAMFIGMFTPQMLNELLALYRQVRRLDPSKGSFSSGLKRALGGLALIPLPASMSTNLIEQLASSQGEGDNESAVPPLSRARRPSGTSERPWPGQQGERARDSFKRDGAGPPNDPSDSTHQANRFWSGKRSQSCPVISSSDFKAQELHADFKAEEPQAKSGGLFEDLELKQITEGE